jgi:NitT/TauT family transport system ATP-binding protein
MRSRPGRVHTVVDIDLDRDEPERDIRSTREFGAYRHEVWSLLRSADLRPATQEVDRVA